MQAMARPDYASPLQFSEAFCEPRSLGRLHVPDGATECGTCLMVVPDVPRCSYCLAPIDGFSLLQVRLFDRENLVPLEICLLLARLRLNAQAVGDDVERGPSSASSTAVPATDDALSDVEECSGSSTTELETDIETEPDGDDSVA